MKGWINMYTPKNYLKNKGFTLVELLVVISIIAILSAFLVPSLAKSLERSREATDIANLKILNDTSLVYKYEGNFSADLFEGIDNDNDRIDKLVTEKYLDKAVQAQRKEYSFFWNVDNQKWNYLQIDSGPYIVFSNEDGLTTILTGGLSGSLSGTYTGSEKDILIPLSSEGQDILAVQQDVFKGANLTSITFPTNSQIKRFHARSFQNNLIENVILPPSLERIDYGAFMNNQLKEINLSENINHIEGKAFIGNPITKVTINAGVTLGDRIFYDNASDNFKSLYTNQGAGTYNYSAGVWSKE